MNKVNNIKKCIIYAIPSLWIVIMYYSSNIIYYVCDDAMMNNIARGFFDGKINDHTIITNIVMGYIVKGLYSITMSVNWYAIIYILIILLCAYVLLNIFIKNTNQYLALCIVMALESMCIYWFSFTVIAYTCMLVGMLQFVCCMKETKDVSKYKLIAKCALTIILILLGYMLRQKAMYSGVVMLIPLIIYGIKIRVSTKRVLAVCSITIILLLSLVLLNSAAYSSKLWNNFWDFEISRIKVNDYPISSFEDERDFYNSIDYSENDVRCISRWCFGDIKVFNKTNFDKIVKNTSFTNRYAVYTSSYIKVIKKYVFFLSWLSILFFFIVTVISIIYSKRKLLVILQGVLTLGMVWITFFIQRPLPRVIIPLLLTGMVSMIFLAIQQKEKVDTKKYFFVIGMTMFIMFAIFTIKNISNVKQYKTFCATKQTTTKKYLNEHKKDLFLCYSKTNLLYNNPVVEIKGKEVCSNLVQIGDQDIYSDIYYWQMKKFKVSNKYRDRLLLNLLYRKNTYLIVDKDRDGAIIDLVQKYLSEHTGKQVKNQVLKKLDNNISVYKFVQEQIKGK